MANSDRGLDEVAPVMSPDAMKVDRLEASVHRQVGRDRQLFESRRGAAHRHDDPADSFPLHQPLLVKVFGIISVDRGERQQGLYPFASNDPPQRPWALPGASNHPMRHHRRHPSLTKLGPEEAGQPGREAEQD